MILASIWLALCCTIGFFAWFAMRGWVALLLPIVAALMAFVVWYPTGAPRFTHPPKGKYEVRWADIKVDDSILILLDNHRDKPIYYILPYSEKEANNLQSAMNDAQFGGEEAGKVTVEVTGSDQKGEKYIGEPPVKGNPPKE